MPKSKIFDANGIHEPAANTAAVITLAATAGKQRAVDHIAWSYSGAPTGGKLSVSLGGTDQFVIDITAAGPGEMRRDIVADTNKALVITLAAGGAGVTGKVNCRHYLI